MVRAGIFALLGEAGAIAGSAVWVSFLAAGLVPLALSYAMAKMGTPLPVLWRSDHLPDPRLRQRPAGRRLRLARLPDGDRGGGRDGRRLLRGVRQRRRRRGQQLDGVDEGLRLRTGGGH